MRLTLTLGTTTNDRLREDLRAAGIRTNAYVDALFPSVVTASRAHSVTIESTTIGLLGLPNGATLDALIEHAAVLGLVPAPLEAAVHLRLAWRDDVVGERLTVVSPRPLPDESAPRGFYLKRDDEGLWLRAFVASDDWIFDTTERVALLRV